MTTPTYCPPLAEVDNSLVKAKLKSGIQSGCSAAEQQQLTLKSIKRQKLASDHTNDWMPDCSMGESRSLDAFHNDRHSTTSESCTDSGNIDSEQEQQDLNLSDNFNYQDDHEEQVCDYANGWIFLMESGEVSAGQTKRGMIFGRNVIVYRPLDGGKVEVLIADCPYLADDPRIDIDDNQAFIGCKHHEVAFRISDGKFVVDPSFYKEFTKTPKEVYLRKYISDELDGKFIYVWYHGDYESPSWFLKPVEEFKDPKWQLIAKSCHTCNMDMRDLLENGADINHFDGIHNDLFIFGSNIHKLRPFKSLQKYFHHNYVPKWAPLRDDEGKPLHLAKISLQSWISIFKLRVFDITVHANQIGPGIVHLRYNSLWYGKGLLTMNILPLGGRRIKYIQHMYTERSLFQSFMAKWVFLGEVKMLERDLHIWNHKKKIDKPLLVAEDKCLKQFRTWYAQFYKRKPNSVEQDARNSVRSREIEPGWRRLLSSSEVQVGTVKGSTVRGKDVIVCRSEDGKIDVLEAYCPHLGVYLGDGQLKRRGNQSQVQCPFHGWSFDTSSGQCVDIPYQEATAKVPKNSHLKTYISKDEGGHIYIWLPADSQPPGWKSTPVNEAHISRMVCGSRHDSSLDW